MKPLASLDFAVDFVQSLDLPFAAGRARARLHAMGVVEAEEQREDGTAVTVRWTERQKAQWQAD